MNLLPASILVVDDSPVNRILITATLRREGYRLLEADDGRSGLEAIERENPELVILDLMMPRMDGAEMARLMRARRSSSAPRILLMTALNETDSAAKARELGADSHLAKPFSPADLRLRVKELLTPSRTDPKAGANA